MSNLPEPLDAETHESYLDKILRALYDIHDEVKELRADLQTIRFEMPRD
jgi:hypothetical protein